MNAPSWTLHLILATALLLGLLPGGLGTSLGSVQEAGRESQGQSGSPDEYEVKAGFLYNFSLFVRWPDHAFENPGSPLVFGVYGRDPFGRVLDRTLAGKRAHDREIVIRRFHRPQDVQGCHLLFVPRSSPEDLRRLFPQIAGLPILLVGEQEDFATQGGLISFYLEQSRVRFEINPEEARRREIRISSKLLGLARIVGGERTR